MLKKLKEFKRQNILLAGGAFIFLLILVSLLYRVDQRINRLESDLYDAQQQDNELEDRLNDLENQIEDLDKKVTAIKREQLYLLH